MKKIYLLLLCSLVLCSQLTGCQQTGEVSDVDGNVYRTVIIGEQEWMAENLKTTTYDNGDPIPNIIESDEWSALATGAWCYYDNDEAYDAVYAKLYNWYAVVDPRNLCPADWHVPSDDEWTALTDYLGGESEAGGKMKSNGTREAGTGLWKEPNAGATRSERFYRSSGRLLFRLRGIRFYWRDRLLVDTDDGYCYAGTRRLGTISGTTTAVPFLEATAPCCPGFSCVASGISCGTL